MGPHLNCPFLNEPIMVHWNINYCDKYRYGNTLNYFFTKLIICMVSCHQVIQQNEPSEPEPPGSSKYRLVGVLVHSGQASGGHYYSYITQRNVGGADGERNRWYKFDDGDVTECKMDDEEEMKNQCFGGEYMGEVFDHMMKRMSYRRQKRWWNAYILFYERMDSLDKDSELVKYIQELTISSSSNNKPSHQVKMPNVIECSVRKQNVQFMHNRMQYSLEYFQFVKKLLTCNSVYLNPPPGTWNRHTGFNIHSRALFKAGAVDATLRFCLSPLFPLVLAIAGHCSTWTSFHCRAILLCTTQEERLLSQ